MAITKITTPELFNLQSNNTEGTRLPVMTTTQREAMTGMSNGELIFNSTTDSVEYYDLGVPAWYKIDYDSSSNPSLIADTKLLLEAFNSNSYSGTGSIWTDLSAEQDNATLFNISSNNNQYFDFNGTNQYMQGASAITYQKYSVCMWINPDVTTTGSLFETGDLNGTGVNNNRLFFSGSTFYATMNGGNSGYATTSASNFPVNTWTFVCVAYSNSSVGIYKNNATFLSSATTTGSFGSTANYRIGTNKNAGTNRQYFNGQISKVQTIARFISTTEMQFLYSLGKGF